jgi:hypothetical protein
MIKFFKSKLLIIHLAHNIVFKYLFSIWSDKPF